MMSKDIRVIIVGPIIGNAENRCKLVDKYIEEIREYEDQTVTILSPGRPDGEFAEYYASKRNYALNIFCPDLRKYKDRAYVVRTSRMISYARNGVGLTVVFVDGDDLLGTTYIAQCAKEQSMRVISVRPAK